MIDIPFSHLTYLCEVGLKDHVRAVRFIGTDWGHLLEKNNLPLTEKLWCDLLNGSKTVLQMLAEIEQTEVENDIRRFAVKSFIDFVKFSNPF